MWCSQISESIGFVSLSARARTITVVGRQALRPGPVRRQLHLLAAASMAAQLWPQVDVDAHGATPKQGQNWS